MSTVQGARVLPTLPQPSRVAPRPPNRPAPSGPSNLPSAKVELTPLPADLRLRTKAQGPPVTSSRNDSLSQSEQQARQVQLQQDRQEQQWLQEQQQQKQQWQLEQQKRLQEQKQQERLQQQQEQQERQQLQQQKTQELTRPPLPPSKSSPATSTPATHPATGAAGSTTGPPPVLPLQPTKKVQIQAQEKPTKAAVGNGAGSVAAAAAALEKPKEKRISTMTEVQIMEKLRQVVSEDDPKLLYSKIKKVGQG